MNERTAAIAEATLIVNAGARRGRAWLDRTVAAFEKRGVRPGEIVAAEDARAFVARARAASRPGRLVVAGGGDGSITSICGDVAAGDATLGVVPLGTGNSFARSLGLPLDIEGAVDALFDGVERRIDLGYMGDVAFANFAALGLSANVAGSTPSALKRVLGPLAYLAVGFALTRKHRAFECRLFAGDEERPRFSGMTHQVVIANGRYFGTVPILPDATLEDGELSVFAVAGAHRNAVLRFWLAMLGGADPRELPQAVWFESDRVRIECTPRKPVELDGQQSNATPQSFRVVPRALRTIVPMATVAAKGLT